MLMVVTEIGWSFIIYDYAEMFGSFFASSLFFNSFYLLVKHIILSLLTGLIWEIFTIISHNLGKKKKPVPNKTTTPEAKVNHSESSKSSNLSDLAEVNSIDGNNIDPRRLMKISDEHVRFVRKRLRESKINELKNQEISIERDDFSLADLKMKEIDDKKESEDE